jgi:transcriptional regulator with XRE-family HTH domain
MDDLHAEERTTRGRPPLTERAKEIAKRIAQSRALAEMTQEDCASQLGISKTQYQYIEKQCSPAMENAYLPRLAKLLSVPLQWLDDGIGDIEESKQLTEFHALSLDEAQWLGARAQARREELSLSRNDLALLINISTVNLMNWERSFPRKRRSAEIEWEKQLQVPEGWLRLTHLKPFPPAPFPVLEQQQGMTVATEMRAVCSWFSRKSPFQRTTDYSALDESEQRMADIMLYRYGVFGEDASTLQCIGNRLGLTRERVRQISENFIANLNGEIIGAPALDQLKSAMQSNLPCKVDELDRAYRGLLGESLSVAGADQFAREVLGRTVVRIVTRPANMQGHTTPMAIQDDAPDDGELRAVRQVAVSMVRISGAAQVHFVAGMSSTVLKRGVTPEEVVRCCRIFSNFEWISEEDGWFWFGPAADNRAKTAAFKVLSVATRNVDVEEIHDAMARARLLRYNPDKPRPYLLDAPLSVLREVLARIPGIEKLQYNDFRLDVLRAPEEVLSDTELAIYNVLMRYRGVASRHTIIEEGLASLDVTPMALNFALDSSPILVRLDKGIWSIRGYRISGEAVSAAIVRHSSSIGGGPRFLPDEVRPVDGWWKLRVTVPESAFTRRHWIVPVAVATLLQPGEYTVDGYVEPASYLVGVNPNLGGFVGKLVAAGIGSNEVFVLYIHETERLLRFQMLHHATQSPTPGIAPTIDQDPG